MPDISVIKRSEKRTAVLDGEDPIYLKDLKPNHTTVKTNSAAAETIAKTDLPQKDAALEHQRVTLPPSPAIAVENAAASAGVGTECRAPDFAFAVIKVAIAREAAGSEKLKALSAQVKEQLNGIDLF